MAEVASQGALRQFGDGSGKLHAGRPAADDDEGHEPSPLGLVRLHLGTFEGEQDVLAHDKGVVQGLEGEGSRAPVLAAEIRVLRPCGEDESVVFVPALFRQHRPRGRVESRDPVHHDSHVAAASKQQADRHGDVGRRHGGGGDLVEQRLEQMMVLLIDEGDLHGRILQSARGRKPPETGADDDNFRELSPARPACRSNRRLRHWAFTCFVFLQLIPSGAKPKRRPACRQFMDRARRLPLCRHDARKTQDSCFLIPFNREISVPAPRGP